MAPDPVQMPSTHLAVGYNHLLVDLWFDQSEVLKHVHPLRAALTEAARAGGARVRGRLLRSSPWSGGARAPRRTGAPPPLPRPRDRLRRAASVAREARRHRGVCGAGAQRPGGEEYTEELRSELRGWVRKEIGPIATPDVIHWAPGLPKTRSGKIMRRILRKIAENDTSTLGDTSTLADPSVVDTLIETR